jgi:Na+-translocating ferredoxin:NAD+ oxidoreductase RnfD subunit
MAAWHFFVVGYWSGSLSQCWCSAVFWMQMMQMYQRMMRMWVYLLTAVLLTMTLMKLIDFWLGVVVVVVVVLIERELYPCLRMSLV